MNVLRIRLFGGLQLWRGDELLPAFPTQRARSLFAYVALHRTRLHARELLVGQLWGDEGEASGRKTLRMALWRARGIVDPPDGIAGPSPLRVTTTQLGFNSESSYWLDVEEFEHLLAPLQRRPGGELDDAGAELVRRAVDLYAGDLLEDMFDDWCLYERERLRLLYHAALESLMRYEEERGAWGPAIALGQRLLALDPLMEQVHRELMLCYLRRGSRAAALRQFESCTQVLRAELMVEPMQETVDLYLRIRDAGEAPAPVDSQAERTLQRVDRALGSLTELVGQLEEARGRLAPAAMRAMHFTRSAEPVEAPPGRL